MSIRKGTTPIGVFKVKAGGINLINLSVTPSASSQTFNHSGYDGYDIVSVNGIQAQSKSITPSETAQTVTPDSGYSGLSQVNVGAISSTYVGSGVTKQAAKTITPTKSSQTAVAASVYTTGAVTVAAIPAQYITTTDANATAGDIVSTKTAYVNGSKITGNLIIQTYYTGSTEPSSSLGNNGDIYLRG